MSLILLNISATDIIYLCFGFILSVFELLQALQYSVC